MFTKIRRWLERSYKTPLRQIGQVLYWFRTHTYNKYHLIDIRCKRNGYSWGWIDKSEAILFANMAILVDFIEKEKAFESHVDWRSAAEVGGERGTENDPSGNECRGGHAKAKKEILEIYNWWVKGRKEEYDALEAAHDEAYKDMTTDWKPCKDSPKFLEMVTTNPPSKEVVEALWKQETALEDRDKEMMIRLIKVSGYMWT